MIRSFINLTYIRIYSNLIFLIPLISAILLILSSADIFLYQYPADAFYYFKSLTLIYWIGFSLAILNIFLSLQKDNRHYRIIQIFAIVLFGMYMHGIPNLVYETPRYMDVYAHGSHLAFLIKKGYIETETNDSYAYEYPSLFVLTAILFNIMNPIAPYNFLNYPYNFFRLFPIFALLFIAILIYILALKMLRKYSGQYSNLAVIAPFTFLSMNWGSLGHFAPHTFSFILYIILIIILIHKDVKWMKRNIITSLSLLLIVINMTNPTNAAMLSLTLSFIILVSLFSNYINIYRNIVYKRLYLIIILSLVIFAAWTSFSGENMALANAKRYMDDFIERAGDLNRLQLTPSPNESYYLANVIRIMQTSFVSITSIILLFFLLKRNKLINDGILMLVGLVSLTVLITVTIFASSALLARVPIYIILPFAILLPYCILSNVILKRMKLIFMIVIAIWSYTIPIIFYAWDAFFYLNPSLLYTEKLLNEHFSQSATIHTISSSRSGVRYYDSFDLEYNFQYSRHLTYERYQTNGTSYILIMLSKARIDTINFVVLSEIDNNRIKMQNSDYEFYDNLKIILNEDRFNRLLDVSTTIIFGD